MLAAKVDEFGKAGWIAATVLGFWAFWPVGVALLLFLAFSGRIRAWRHEGPGQWHNVGPGGQRGRGWAWGGCGRGRGRFAPSGNAAFDDYRAETIRRLEEEQQEFQTYLERLRQAKDKAEFDQFMADRRNRREPEGGVPEASAG